MSEEDRASDDDRTSVEDGTSVDGYARERLDPRIITVWRLQYLVRAGVVALVTFFFIQGAPVAVTAAAVVVFAAYLGAALIAPGARYRRWEYAARESDLVLRRGVLVRTVSLVPYSRIQHVDTRRGPIERTLGLASVVVYTAGSVGAALVIPGLDAERADALRDRLANLGAVGDAV